MEYFKFYLPSLCLVLISIFFFSAFVFAQQVESSSFSAKPSNSVSGAESFYALHVKLHDPSSPLRGVDTITVRFTSGFDISNASIVQALNNPALTKKDGNLIFTYHQISIIDSTIVVDGIINPQIAGVYQIALTGYLGGDQVFGPLVSKVGIVPVSEIITNNSITSNLMASDSISGRELSEVSKILFFECHFKVVQSAPDARGINFENHGWVTVFGKGLAMCDAPGVKEGDLVMVGPSNNGGGSLEFIQPRAHNDAVQIMIINDAISPVSTSARFDAPVIIFKK